MAKGVESTRIESSSDRVDDQATVTIPKPQQATSRFKNNKGYNSISISEDEFNDDDNEAIADIEIEKGADEIKFLTFNTWGLKFVSKNRRERLHAIADKIASMSSDYDIIALQEVWVEEDWDYFTRVCSSKYFYHRKFSSGILTGPGLAILSKIPIKSTFLYRFPINGRPSAFFRGDWYVGKSVAITYLEPSYPNATPVAILNSHMHAPYSLTGDAAYSCHRACQAWEIATLINMCKDAGYAVVLVGDLNSRPGSLPYNILQYEGGLRDSWECLYGISDLNMIKKLDPISQIKIGGTTCDSTLNTWRADRKVDEACRLDYALIDDSKFKVIKASVEFTEDIPNIGSHSDHFAYSATLKVAPVTSGKLKNSRLPSLFAQEKLQVYDDLKFLVQEYIQCTNQMQSKWRLIHFWVSMALVIAFVPVIVVLSVIVAPWSSVILLIAGVLIGITGVIDGLIGFLFGRNEKRALQEVVLQIGDKTRTLRHRLEGSDGL